MLACFIFSSYLTQIFYCNISQGVKQVLNVNRLTGRVEDAGKDSDDVAASDKAEEKSRAGSLKSVSKMF